MHRCAKGPALRRGRRSKASVSAMVSRKWVNRLSDAWRGTAHLVSSVPTGYCPFLVLQRSSRRAQGTAAFQKKSTTSIAAENVGASPIMRSELRSESFGTTLGFDKVYRNFGCGRG